METTKPLGDQPPYLNDEEWVLRLPSITTVVFVLVITALLLPNLIWSSSTLVRFDTFLYLLAFGVGLRLFFTLPRRMVERHHMRAADSVAHLSLATRVEEWCMRLNLKRSPTILLSETAGAQAFGTFGHRYLVLNTATIANADSIALDWILVHELAHFKTGDHWKLALTQHLLVVYLFLAMLGIPVTALTTEEFRYLAPGETAHEMTDLLLTGMYFAVAAYLVLLLQRSRELYADTWANKLVGPHGIAALVTPGISGASRPGRGLTIPAALRVWSPNATRDRFDLNGTAAAFRSINLQVLFAGGSAAAASSLLRGGAAALGAIAFVATVIALWLTILYSLPFLVRNPTHQRTFVKAAGVAALLVAAGIAAYTVVYQFAERFVAAALDRSVNRLVQPLGAGVDIAWLLLIWTTIIVTVVAVTALPVRRLVPDFQRGNASGWFLSFLWLSLSVAMFSILLVVVMGIGLSAADPSSAPALVAIVPFAAVTAVFGLIQAVLITRSTKQTKTEASV